MLDKKAFKSSKIASVRKTLKIEDAVNYGLHILGKGDPFLKGKQLEILRYITLEKRDVMAILPTGWANNPIITLKLPR